MLLLKWQAVILNTLYETTLFDKIVTKSSSLDDLDYALPLQIYAHLSHQEPPPSPVHWLTTQDFLKSAHLLCKSQDLEAKKQHILILDRVAASLGETEEGERKERQRGEEKNEREEKNEKNEKNEREEEKKKKERTSFGFWHVLLFSCLSKCSIWPCMFKTSRTLVPSLIEFYNRFFNTFTKYLDYKFDPLILSPKYNKLVKQIRQQRLAHPQLFQAVQHNNIPLLRQLVEEGQPNILNQCMKNGLYISHVAASSSGLPTLRALQELGANFQLLDEEEQTALFYAVKREQLEVIRFLVEEVKVDINHKQYQDRTPIYLAAFEGNLEIVEYLHSKGGNPEVESKLSRTPLSKACYLGNVQVADYLIRLGVNIEAVDHKGRTALHNAAWGRAGGREGKRRGHLRLEDSPECAELLLKAGHRIDFEDNDKFTPLFSAISSDAERSLRVLVKYGANLGHKTVKGESAVFIACKYGHLDILKILVEEYHCNFLEETVQGYTPLMAALTQQTNDCFNYMLSLLVKNKVPLELTRATLQCLVEFGQWKHLKYLGSWLQQEEKEVSRGEKGKLLGEAFDRSLDELLQFTLGLKDHQKTTLLLETIGELQGHLSKQSIAVLLSQIQKQHIFNDEVIRILLSEHSKGLVLPKIPLSEAITEAMLVRLLQVDSSLTLTAEDVYHTLLSVIRMRFTKVILFLLGVVNADAVHLEGIGKHRKAQLLGVIYGKKEGRISVLDYCLVNGYFDMYKLLCSFYNQNYEVADVEMQNRPAIPNYKYSVMELNQPRKCFLMPVKEAKTLLAFKGLCSLLSQTQLQLFQQVTTDINTLLINPKMVSSLGELQQMREWVQERRLVGIDIQHYSSHNQSFICLIQIATMERVFLIDKFSRIHNEVELFLNQLFQDQNIVKIFHSYDNDLKWLCEDYHIDRFHSVLDTSRIYSLLSAHNPNTPSLKSLAAQFLHLHISKEYQRSDWRIRPLFHEMAQYAATDAIVLPYLLLAMLQKTNIDTKRPHCQQLIKSMENKRMLKSTNRKNLIQLL